MSLRELARLAGVSVATASRVFSGGGPVRVATRARVLELAETTGFRPSAIGQAAFGRGTRSIGVLTVNLGISYFADVLTGVQDRLLADGYLPIVLQKFTAGGVTDTHGVERLIEHRVDGLIMEVSDERLEREDFLPLLRAGLPLVSVGAYHAGLACDSVRGDDVQGGHLAGAHLMSLGHRRIAHTHYGEGRSDCDLRVDGFRRAFAEAGVPFDEALVARLPPRGADNADVFRNELRALLTLPRGKRPTAVFATTDLLAMDVYAVARDEGISIPDELSVVGFAGLSFAPFVTPPLTTVQQPGVAVGTKAADLMLARLKEPARPFESVAIPTELVVRGSTARRS